MQNSWTVILEPAEEGGYTATVAGYPYVVSEGETEDEARENVLEALTECIENDRRRAVKAASAGALVLTA